MDVPAFKSAFPSAVNAQTGVSYDDSMAKCEFGLKKHDKLFCWVNQMIASDNVVVYGKHSIGLRHNSFMYLRKKHISQCLIIKLLVLFESSYQKM